MMIFRYFLALIAVSFALSVNAQTVFKTPSGKKYHLESCKMVKNVSQEITVDEAKELGLTACKICKPQNIYESGVGNHKAQGAGKTVQCSGYTKSGNRCRHMTRIANGYCYQHQPG